VPTNTHHRNTPRKKRGGGVVEAPAGLREHGVTDTGEVKFSGAENNFGSYPDICFYGN